MVEALLRVEEKVDLGKVEALIRRANELRTNLEALAQALASKYSSDPRLGSAVANLLRSIQPPEPPSEQVLSLSNSLERYVSALESSVRTLASYAVALERLCEGLSKLEKEVAELEAWGELVKGLAPHLAAEASRTASDARRILSYPLSDDPERTLEEVERALKEVRSQLRLCKNLYTSRLNELLGEASQLEKTLKRALRLKTPIVADALVKQEEALRALVKRLEEASRSPLEAMLDLSAAKRELEELERRVSELAENVLSEEESGVAREVERLARAFENRALSYSLLVEGVSRKCGVPLEKAGYLLYLLEKKGFLTLEVRIKV